MKIYRTGRPNNWLGDHYLGSINANRVLASYTDGLAVAVFARPTRGNMHLGFKSIELARLWSPDSYEGPLSRFLSCSVRQFRKEFGDISIIVAYADPSAGHHGGIYRASSWVFAGESSGGGPQGLVIDGEYMHARTVNHRFGHASVKRLRGEGHTVTVVPRVRKAKYYFPLTRVARKVLLKSVGGIDRESK